MNSEPVALVAGPPTARAGHLSSRPVPVPLLGHQGLLTLARKVHAAATDGDPERLNTAACEFADALGAHLRNETFTRAHVAPSEERILRRGQARLWAVAHDLVAEAEGGCPRPHRYCTSRAEDLLTLMTLQAHEEHRVFSHHAA